METTAPVAEPPEAREKEVRARPGRRTTEERQQAVLELIVVERA